MDFKTTKLHSVITAKCPRCHKGDFFETANPYNLRKFDKMNKRCSLCGQDFEMETGFYYGAMYVSYGLTVVFGVLVYLLSRFVFGITDIQFLWFFPVTIILLAPIFYRSSRLVWINMFVKYSP
jgi:uncharacterized protein (DUF983 family)